MYESGRVKKILVVTKSQEFSDAADTLCREVRKNLDTDIQLYCKEDLLATLGFISYEKPDMLIVDTNGNFPEFLETLHNDIGIFVPMLAVADHISREIREKLTYEDASVLYLKRPVDWEYIRILTKKMLNGAGMGFETRGDNDYIESQRYIKGYRHRLTKLVALTMG